MRVNLPARLAAEQPGSRVAHARYRAVRSRLRRDGWTSAAESPGLVFVSDSDEDDFPPAHRAAWRQTSTTLKS